MLLSDEQAQKIFQDEHCNISKDLAGILYRAIEAAVLAEQAKQAPFDATDPSFREAFEASLKSGNWPMTRLGEGYRSSLTMMAFTVAYETVNRLRLYTAPVVQQPDDIKDAARYRYMRSNGQFQDRNGPGVYWYLPRWNRELPLGERLDAAIDAAMGNGQS